MYWLLQRTAILLSDRQHPEVTTSAEQRSSDCVLPAPLHCLPLENTYPRPTYVSLFFCDLSLIPRRFQASQTSPSCCLQHYVIDLCGCHVSCCTAMNVCRTRGRLDWFQQWTRPECWPQIQPKSFLRSTWARWIHYGCGLDGDGQSHSCPANCKAGLPLGDPKMYAQLTIVGLSCMLCCNATPQLTSCFPSFCTCRLELVPRTILVLENLTLTIFKSTLKTHLIDLVTISDIR